MATLKQSTAYTRTFLMVDSSDHLSPKTGLTVGVYLSKAGGAFGAVSGSVSEISFGWYKAALNATDTNTLGDLAYHCTGSASDLTDFVDEVKANILGDTLPANVTQWIGVVPNALISGTVDGFQHYPVTQNANVVQWNGTAPNNLISGTVDTFAHYSNILNANVSQWVGVAPNNLISGTVDSYHHYPVTQDANIVSWRGVTPNILISGTVDVFSHYANPTQAFLTGTVDVNLTQWRGTQPNILISGTVDSFEHYGNPIRSYHTGTVDANLIQIDGAATNGNNAILYLKQLNITNNNGTALVAESVGGNGNGAEFTGGNVAGFGIKAQGGPGGGSGVLIRSSTDPGGHGIQVYAPNGSSAVDIAADVGAGILIVSNNDSVYLESAVAKSINAFSGIAGDIVGNITGSLTGNIYGDIHGYVGWVTGSVQNVLVSTPAAPPTGTVNANVIQWIGDTPNLLISGTVDAFSHYSNPVQANVSITGTIDANVVTWKGNQPNDLISGTVDSYHHYPTIQDANIVEVNSNSVAAATLKSWLDLFIFAKVVDVTPASNSFDTDLASSVDGFYRDRILMFTSGALTGQGATIYSYIGLSKTLFFDEAFTSAPANGDDFVLLPSHMHPITQIGDYAALLTWSNALPGAYTAGQAGNILGNIDGLVTGTINANVVEWEGAVPNALISGTVDSFTHYTNYPSTSITGSVDANVIAWRGNQPNDLISGTVDAFVHYSNPVQAYVTGTVDANVVIWRNEQPNLLISGTVDAYAHYGVPSTTDISTSVWAAGTRTLTSFGTLIADIWAAVVDSSGVTTLLSRLTAGRATNLDNLDDAISNVPTANENADALLKRDWTAVTGEASRSVLNALRFIRNKFSTTAHANKVTIYKEDDTTEAYQKDVTTDATADPIVEG